MANVPHKFKNGVKISGTAEVNSDTILTETAAQTITGKTIDGGNNTLQNIPSSALSANVDAAKIADGSVSNTEFQYLDGVTGAIQTQLDAKIASSEKGAANGVATLDGSAKIPTSQLPALAITDVHVVADITARDALTVQEGDVAKVNDSDGSGNPNSYIYDGASWVDLKSDDAVDTVNGQTGTVSLDSDDIAEGATNLYFTDERARDAAGAMATNSSKVSLTYNDTADTLTPDIVAGSLVDADINASAGIDATKIGGGAVSNTEFSYLDGVTGAIQTQLDAKATTQLDNLGTTAINAALLPGTTATIDLGSISKRFNELFANQLNVASTLASNAEVARFLTSNGDNFLEIRGKDSNNMPSGTQVLAAIGHTNSAPATSTKHLGIFTKTIAISGNGESGDILLETGNLTDAGATADSGKIHLKSGTNAGSGVRGDIVLDGAKIDASNTKIVNAADPTAAQDVATKAYVDTEVGGASTASEDDIVETSFAIANNQTTAADVTNFAFDAARSFKALVSVEIDATSDLFEVYELMGIKKGTTWEMSANAVGDISGVDFSITNAGQVQYTSDNYAGFVSGSIKFRAITTTV